MCDTTPKSVEKLESAPKWIDMPNDPSAPFFHPNHPFPYSIPIMPQTIGKPETMPERVAEIDWLIKVLESHRIDQMNMIPIITVYIDAGVPVKAFGP